MKLIYIAMFLLISCSSMEGWELRPVDKNDQEHHRSRYGQGRW